MFLRTIIQPFYVENLSFQAIYSVAFFQPYENIINPSSRELNAQLAVI